MSDPNTSFWIILKNVAYIPAAYLGLSLESYGVLAALMIIDTITGVIRAGVIHGCKTISSRRLSFGILSKMAIIMVPIVIALAGKGVGLNLIILAKGTLSILILSETYSIIGNVQSIRNRKDMHEFDAVNYILTKIRDLLERAIKK